MWARAASLLSLLLLQVAQATLVSESGTEGAEKASTEASMCPGAFKLGGHGNVALTAAGWAEKDEDGGKVGLLSNGVMMPMSTRAYFADTCRNRAYDYRRYAALDLRGKTLRFTTDVSSAGCGCNAALYLVSMRQNPRVSDCGDYYCDANKVCGVSCAEIDIMEANRHAWHSTLHSAHDHNGQASGYGGGGANWTGPRDFAEWQFGEGSTCVDTRQPFEVSASFPVDGSGSLTSMDLKLSQPGKSCSVEISVKGYSGLAKLSTALAEGMTPVVSYWKAKDMLWMDGKGHDQQGPCAKDRLKCGESVKFFDFSITGPGVAGTTLAPKWTEPPTTTSAAVPVHTQRDSVAATVAPSDPALPARANCAEEHADCRRSRCCKQPGTRCYEKNGWWASCMEKCTPVKGDRPPDAWTCRPLGSITPGAGDTRESAHAASLGTVPGALGHPQVPEANSTHEHKQPQTGAKQQHIESGRWPSPITWALAVLALVLLPACAAVAWRAVRFQNSGDEATSVSFQTGATLPLQSSGQAKLKESPFRLPEPVRLKPKVPSSRGVRMALAGQQDFPPQIENSLSSFANKSPLASESRASHSRPASQAGDAPSNSNTPEQRESCLARTLEFLWGCNCSVNRASPFGMEDDDTRSFRPGCCRVDRRPRAPSRERLL